MKKLIIIAVSIFNITLLMADYGVLGNPASPIVEEPVVKTNGYPTTGAPIYPTQSSRVYSTYPATSNSLYPSQTPYVREVSPVRAAAEDVVEGAERIVEAPLNFIP